MVERLLKVFIIMSAIGLFVVLIAGGALFIVSGGEPVQFVREAFIRVELVARSYDLSRPMSNDNTAQRFTINSGDSPTIIAQNLFNANLISDVSLFVNYVRISDIDVRLEAGVYALNQTQTIPEIAELLTDSRSSTFTFRIPEGTRIEEIIELIDSSTLFNFTGADFATLISTGAEIPAGFAEQMGIPTGSSLEGFLFPDTYILPLTVTAVELRDTLLEAFIAQTGTQLWQDALNQGLTMHQAVTFASIIEREAVWPDEHALISSVYRNRYAIGMRLEADPTVQYALNGSRGTWWPNITLADYRGVVSPHNTYVSDGLPPNPIANPSASAIRAAIYPVQSDYFFFRAKCDGSFYHNFAVTYDEHLANGC